MGKRCVVAGCSNTHKDGVSLFKFPSDKKLRREWIRQVQRTRAKWKDPGEYSCVCSAHFAEDYFQAISSMCQKVGLKMKQMLKPDAVPTIFPRPSDTKIHKRVSSAYKKREHIRVCLIVDNYCVF